MDGASRIASTADPPFESINDNFAILALDGEFDVSSVRRGYVSFSHREGRANLAIQKGLEPFLLLFGCTVTSEDLCRLESVVSNGKFVIRVGLPEPMFPVSLIEANGRQPIVRAQLGRFRRTVQSSCMLPER